MGGGSAWKEGCLPRQTPSPVNRMTHACKNITVVISTKLEFSLSQLACFA